jgi:hypothetical protein
MEFDGTALYFAIAASTRGVVRSTQHAILGSTYTLVSQTAAQKLLNATTNGTVTMPVGTYEFECQFSISSMSATSGTFGFALGGTATFTQAWISEAIMTNSGATPGTVQSTYNTAANTTLTSANTVAAGYARIQGIIRITVAGTIIPQVSLTVAAAAVIGTNSFFKIAPIGTFGVTSIGNWS